MAQSDIRSVNWGWSGRTGKKSDITITLLQRMLDAYGRKFNLLYSFTEAKHSFIFFYIN
jgi:hypothetical protein